MIIRNRKTAIRENTAITKDFFAEVASTMPDGYYIRRINDSIAIVEEDTGVEVVSVNVENMTDQMAAKAVMRAIGDL